MATTPTTSIGSSYQRLGGSTSVIKQGAAGPALNASTRQRLDLAEQRKLEEEKAAADRRKLSAMTPYELAEEMGKRYQEQQTRSNEALQRMAASRGGATPHFRTTPSANMSGSNFNPLLRLK
jgi:hypothetical protein